MFDSWRPRLDRHSVTEEEFMVPVLLWSRTEKASRIEWSRAGGSFERVSDGVLDKLVNAWALREIDEMDMDG